MSKVTLKAIEELMDGMLDRKLQPIISILNSHTTTLNILVRNKKDNTYGVE